MCGRSVRGKGETEKNCSSSSFSYYILVQAANADLQNVFETSRITGLVFCLKEKIVPFLKKKGPFLGHVHVAKDARYRLASLQGSGFGEFLVYATCNVLCRLCYQLRPRCNKTRVVCFRDMLSCAEKTIVKH